MTPRWRDLALVIGIGIGLDAVDIDRFRTLLARRPAMLERLFTGPERAALARRADPVPGLAARFAAKEATMKAFGVGLGAIGLTELEVISSPSGAPSLVMSGRAAALARSLGVSEVHVSLTHTAALAGAIVVAT